MMSTLFKNLIMDHRQSFRRLLNEYQYASLSMKFSDFECIESRGNVYETSKSPEISVRIAFNDCNVVMLFNFKVTFDVKV